MARPYKVRDKRTNEIIEFEWDDPTPPTRDDIDRIVSERKSKPFEPEPSGPVDSLINTPRFPVQPSSQVRDEITREPDFRSEVIGNFLPQPEPMSMQEYNEKLPTFGKEATKAYNWATTPIMGDAEESFFKGIGKVPVLGEFAEPIARFAMEGTTSPLGLATLGLGSFAALKGVKAANALRKGATEVDDVAAAARTNAGKKIKEFLGGSEEVLPPISGEPTVTAPTRKPRYRLSIDDEGKRTYVPIPEESGVTNINLPPGYEFERVTPRPVYPDELATELPQKLGAVPPQRNLTAQLPHDLRGAKPRYNIGTTSYEPQFENDIDKALFIVSQDKPSKRNADYMKFVMENTGMTEQEAMAAGKAVRSNLGGVLKGQKLGANNKIPRLYNPIDELSPLPGGVQAEPLPPMSTANPKNVNPATGRLDPLDDISSNVNPPEMNPVMTTPEGKVIADDLQRSMASKTGKTSAMVTGDEVTPPPPQAIKAAKEQTSAVPPSAQAEQSINDFVPKDINEALTMIDAAEKRLKAAGKSETFINHVTTQMWNFPKASWATLDLSAPLRQGKGLIYTGEYWRAFDDMYTSWRSEQGYAETMAKIKLKKTYPIMKKYDPGLIELEKGGKGLLKQEENRMSDWMENIPSLGSLGKALKEGDLKYARTYVFDPANNPAKEALGKTNLISRGSRASNRAYSGFLNTLRADRFENMILNFEKMGLDPYNDPKLLKYTADYISTATGRASLGNFEAAAETLNKYSFSVRFAKSRLDMGVLAPVKWAKAPDVIKKEVAKSLVSQALYTSGFLTLAHAAGAEVTLDPTSSDFGKAKIGNTRIDTMAGMQQPMIATIRILSRLSTSPTTGKTTELGEGYRPETGVDVAANFTRSKLSPWTGLGYDAVLKGKTISGKDTMEEMQRVDLDNYFFKMLAPNLVSTLSDLAQEDPAYLAQLGIPLSRFITSDGKPIPIPVILTSLGIVGAAALGESIQVFDEPPPQKERKKGLGSFSYEPRKK